MLFSLSLLGVVAARIRSQHQLVIGQKHSSEVAVSAEGKLDSTSKIPDSDIGRFKKKESESWLYCPDILKSNGNPEAYCRFTPNPAAANVWKMRRGGVLDGVQQFQFVDQSTERCLMRQSCHSSTSALSLADPTRYWSSNQNCNHCGTKHWQYTASSFKLAEHTDRNCVQRDGHIRHCTRGSYQKLVFVPGRYEVFTSEQPVRAGKVFASMTNEKNGLIGSVYFDWGRIRTVHAAGPEKESNHATWSWAQFNYKEADSFKKYPHLRPHATDKQYYAALEKFCGELIAGTAGCGAIEIKTPADAFADVKKGAGYIFLECGKDNKTGKFNGKKHPSRGYAVQYTLTAEDATALKAGITEVSRHTGNSQAVINKQNNEFYKKVKNTGIGKHIRATPRG